MNYPSFSEAEKLLIEFLQENNFPEKVEWINKKSMAYLGKHWVVFSPKIVSIRNEVEQIYKQGKLKPHGIKLAVLCASKRVSYCYISCPRTEIDAEYTLMGNGLKLSMPSNNEQCACESRKLKWIFYKLQEFKYLRWKSARFE